MLFSFYFTIIIFNFLNFFCRGDKLQCSLGCPTTLYIDWLEVLCLLLSPKCWDYNYATYLRFKLTLYGILYGLQITYVTKPKEKKEHGQEGPGKPQKISSQFFKVA